jgi:hypothetical protein
MDNQSTNLTTDRMGGICPKCQRYTRTTMEVFERYPEEGHDLLFVRGCSRCKIFAVTCVGHTYEEYLEFNNEQKIPVA